METPYRDGGRSKNLEGRVRQVVMCPNLVDIGLTDLSKSGGGASLPPPLPPSLELSDMIL